MANENQKYNYMENPLQTINRNYICLLKKETSRNNHVLKQILLQIVTKMKKQSPLFSKLFSRAFYGGSYYDGLRVEHPEEFDIDLLLLLPKNAGPTLNNSNIPGFVHLQLQDYGKFENQPEALLYPGLKNLMNDKYLLLTDKVYSWFEGVVTKALNEFPKLGHVTILKTSIGKFHGTIRKTGPVITLQLEYSLGSNPINIAIDLAPCLELTGDKWPHSPYRQNPVPRKPNFFVVPKKPSLDVCNVEHYWRLSFQEQERALIHNLFFLKPAMKLLKKLRNSLGHEVMASYYIKTIFLWEVERDNEGLWYNSLSYVFMTMLRRYQEYMERGQIPYYWYPKNDLLQKLEPSTKKNMSNQLKRMINEIDVDKQCEDLFDVVAYFVHPDKIEMIKSEMNIGKRTLKRFLALKIKRDSV